jgi:hypothetical protein
MWLAPIATVLALAAREPGCSDAEVNGLVSQFVGAFNTGSPHRLKGVWSQRFFHWYSATAPERHSVVYTRRGFLAYAVRRHRQHETVMLLTFKFNGYSSGHGHFEYALMRRADDLNSGDGARYYGKGAAYCAGTPHKLVVWSMGYEP